jgi:hypothetical protein
MSDKRDTTSPLTVPSNGDPNETESLSDEEILDYLVHKTAADIVSAKLTTTQVKLLYDAIVSKVEWKTCHLCGKLGVAMEGESRRTSMDLSAPKQFVCRQCLIKEMGGTVS